MKKIKIITDSCADLSQDAVDTNQISRIDMTLIYGEKEIAAKNNWSTITQTELYDGLRIGKIFYTLDAIETEIEKTFLKYLKQDMDIIYIACCIKQSITVEKARKIAKKLLVDYPESKIEIIDSLNASVGEGLLAVKAAELASQGLEIEEIVKKVEKLRKHVIEFVTVDTLTYLSRANKVQASTAMLANMLNIKPILVSDVEGSQVSYSKVKGREKSLYEIVRLFLENVVHPEEQDIYIVHGDDIKAADFVEKLLNEAGLKCKNIIKICVGPIIGISTGPGMVGLFGFGKEVTFKGK